MRQELRIRWRQSLLIRYVLIVFIALVLWIIIYPMISVLMMIPYSLGVEAEREHNPYTVGADIEARWHAEAKKLDGAKPEQIDAALRSLHREYDQASLFWVDHTGRTQLMLPEQPSLHKTWDVSDTIAFMKSSYGGDPFTVVAFIGQDQEQGFMVIQVPRELMKVVDGVPKFDYRAAVTLQITICVGFVLLSLLFFLKIRKRLVQLERAMTATSADGLPQPTIVQREDEIGRVEHAFNQMVQQLKAGRVREQEEEMLRKNLIANLSHDIRTPLTTIRAHTHSLHHENLSVQGAVSLKLIDHKIEDLGQLVDNLLSYTLLSAKRYEHSPQQVDLTRLVRQSAATWYPVWEKEGISPDISLPGHAVNWTLDPQWMKRVLDNLIHNVVRHAGSGQYIGISLRAKEHAFLLEIMDRGPGLEGSSATHGTGIGLTIVRMMLEEMHMTLTINSDDKGTLIQIRSNLNQN
ncbi:HAMP domain-containing sensor histidine kinase [Paenibacillus marinisediminis]